MMMDPPGYQLEMYCQHGPLMRTSLGKKNFYLFNHPDAVKEILLTKASSFKKGMAVQNVQKIIGNNLLTLEGKDHAQKRKILSKVFSKTYISDFEDVITSHINQKISQMPSEGTLELKSFCSEISMELISLMLFGTPVSKEVQAIEKTIHNGLSLIYMMNIPGNKFFMKLPLPFIQKFKQSQKELYLIIEQLLNSRQARSSRTYSTIDLLIEAGCNQEEIIEHLIVLFIAGQETTSSALVWLLYSTLTNEMPPEFLLEIRKADSENKKYQDILDYPHIQACILETLRLYPSIWNIGRQAIEDIEIAGYQFKKDDYIAISPFVMQRSPKFFKNPNAFDIKRWIVKDCIITPQKFTYFPFSYGTRNCIGKTLSEVEIFCAIKKIFNSIEFTLKDNKKITISAKMTMAPKQEIWVDFKKYT